MRSLPRPSVLAVWTRDLDAVPLAGRVRIASQIREILGRAGELRQHRLCSMFETGLAITILDVLWEIVAAALRRRPVPLQCLLFAGTTDPLEAAAGSVDAVYLDGIRSLFALRRLRREHPELRIVVDLDDLMSRRMALLRAGRLPLSFGYLGGMAPPWLDRMARSIALARLVFRYEAWALRHAEAEILRLADAVVLLSPREADMLREASEKLDAARAAIVVIPPACEVRQAPARAFASPRFVFVGSDALVQNRITIDYLRDLWRRRSLDAELHVFGRQLRPAAPVAGIHVHGYVDDIGEAYVPGSVVVAPTFLLGGIKTKVLEAFAYGVPVVGNPATFEGLELPAEYPLLVEDEETLAGILAAPHEHEAAFRSAARLGQAYVAERHDTASFARRWAALLKAGPEAPAVGAAALILERSAG
jgi:glycosyltransferase involved in cell wall biosynthesis